MLRLYAICQLIPILLVHSSVQGTHKAPKIAVVGAGLGGTSVSYFLKELFGDEKVDIDVFETHEIGGRLATIEIDDQRYETGGSIIHPDNRYMAHFSKKFDLKKKKALDFPSKFGLYDGSKIVFSESNWQIITWMKLLWRYGLNPMTLSNHVEKMLSKFKRIYQLQDKGISFSSVEDLLKAMSLDFIEDVKISSEKGFSMLGLSNRTIDELIMAGLMVNYGQTTSAHKFVGSVAVAAGNGHLWSIYGGNKQIPENLLKYSGAIVINEKVDKISLNEETGLFQVSYSINLDGFTEGNTGNNKDHHLNKNVTKVYDIVIIAAPLTRDTSDIVFENFPSTFAMHEGRYHRTVCTIVKGDLNLKYFGEGNDMNEIFSINSKIKINSVGEIDAVVKHPNKKESKVWKVFSQDLLTDNDLKALFLKMDEVKVVDWLAYPHYDSNQKLGSFVLEKHLYHINVIEWAASAMEMIVIGAKNVALLAYKDWTGKSSTYSQRDEL